MLMSSIVYFYQRQALLQVQSIPYVEVKISWVVYTPFIKHICIESSKYEGLRPGSNYQKSNKIIF